MWRRDHYLANHYLQRLEIKGKLLWGKGYDSISGDDLRISMLPWRREALKSIRSFLSSHLFESFVITISHLDRCLLSHKRLGVQEDYYKKLFYAVSVVFSFKMLGTVFKLHDMTCLSRVLGAKIQLQYIVDTTFELCDEDRKLASHLITTMKVLEAELREKYVRVENPRQLRRIRNISPLGCFSA